MTTPGLWADVAVATVAFAGTNVDNSVVTTAMVAGAPIERAHRIAAGQVAGFCLLVVASFAAAVLLFEFSAAAVGLLGLVPLAIGLRGLVARRQGHQVLARRAVGQTFTAAALVTIGAGGDNLAAYIPLFRVGGGARLAVVTLVFVLGEVAVTALVLWAGRHPRARKSITGTASVAVPVLLCVVGVLVLVQAGTFSLL